MSVFNRELLCISTQCSPTSATSALKQGFNQESFLLVEPELEWNLFLFGTHIPKYEDIFLVLSQLDIR